jgi:putative spermidine/putrescine transport system substrate-binding protein
MVVINFLLSPEAQYSKYLPANWGDYPAIDLDTLDKKEWDRFAAVDHGMSALAPSILAEAGVPELPVEYVRALVRGWQENVGGGR